MRHLSSRTHLRFLVHQDQAYLVLTYLLDLFAALGVFSSHGHAGWAYRGQFGAFRGSPLFYARTPAEKYLYRVRE